MEGPLKVDFMSKRSQMKSRFTSENYRNRWFVLTRRGLSYHDGTLEDGKQGKLKSEIAIKDVLAVETVDKEHLGNRPNAFQVVYREDNASEVHTLYIIALFSEQQKEWIQEIRKASMDAGAVFNAMYHDGVWNPRAAHYTCCDRINRNADGCQPTSHMTPITTAKQNGIALAEEKLKSYRTTPPDDPRPVEPTKPLPTPPKPNENGKPVTLKHSASSASNSSSRGPLPNPPPKGKMVIASYDYNRQQDMDLDLVKGEQYELMDDTEQYWWKARNKQGDSGYIPANYVQVVTDEGLEQYDWFYPNTTRAQSESILKKDAKEGCFLVRESSQKGMYTLSIYAKESGEGIVKHYHIKHNAGGLLYLQERHAFSKIPELIHYHRFNSAGLIVRLRTSPLDRASTTPETAGFGYGKYEIDPKELELFEDLGSGQFGVVKMGKWRRDKNVAVKMMKENTMSEDDFIAEAKTMIDLQHPNLVQLYGVCTKEKPLKIVTEFMKHGALLGYLRRRKHKILQEKNTLLDMCIQVGKAMEFLETKSFIHRDLAARNCLVAEDKCVKVGDFGLARFVLDDEYTSSQGTKFPIRWASPEVLSYTKFSTKSDVWSYGVLMYEVYTGGDMPYGRDVKNTEVVERVCNQRRVLGRPSECPQEVYSVMTKCFNFNAKSRPTFKELLSLIQVLQDADYA